MSASSTEHDLDPRPYVLAVTSHRGGTGRTTLCAGLAWHWSQQGKKITLVDANPVSACNLLVCQPQTAETWPNVTLITAPHGLQTTPQASDIILIDAPPLTEPLCQQSLNLADGVIVTIGTDPFSLASLPQASMRFKEWLGLQPNLELLGLVVPIQEARSPQQNRGLLRLQEFENVLIEPAIPARREFRDWPLTPGAAPPKGPANDALEVLSWGLLSMLEDRIASVPLR